MAVGGIGTAGCLRQLESGIGGDAEDNEITQNTPTAQSGSAQLTVGPGGDLVFRPKIVTVYVGTTVNWVWDSDLHNIVVDAPEDASWSGTPGDQNTYDEGFEYSHTFETDEHYYYECSPHVGAGMSGEVIVVE